jgi:hypothetical protein
MTVRTLAFLPLLTSSALHGTVIFTDNFDDNINTGWTYLNRNGATEIADAVWAETGGRLEQQTANYDFPRDANGNDPVLGAIALAPVAVEGIYSFSADFTSLEPGNGFQDQDLVFGYLDTDNFLIVETIANGGLNFFNVIGGDRTTLGSSSISFNQTTTTVQLEHNATNGEVTITYGAEAPFTFSHPSYIFDGSRSVGVGSNNDAFAIDNFSVEQIPEPGVLGLLALSGFFFGRRRKQF